MYTDTAVGRVAHQKSKLNEENVNDALRLAEYILEKKEELHTYQDDFHYFHISMRELEQTLLTLNHADSLESRATTHLENQDLELLNNLYCLWETNLENRFVDFLKQGVVKHYLDYPLYARFERLIHREVSLLQGLNPKRLLFIGSGPMPITALCLKNRLGTQIDCLERNLDAVNESKAVMKLLGCENEINILHGEGEFIDASNYDVVLVALLAKPKHLILSSIRDSADKNVKIICRTSEGARMVFYEPTLDNAIPDGLKSVAHEKAGIDDTISSYLLEKVL